MGPPSATPRPRRSSPSARIGTCRPSARSGHDAEVGELARVAAPAHVDIVDPSGRWAVVRPGDDLFDGVFLALGDHLDAAVGAVLHPSRDAEATRLALRGGPKEDARHAPANDDLNTLRGHVLCEPLPLVT